jgi:thiol-disulfide isomerase/thioredoxin
MKKWILAAAIVALTFVLSACGQAEELPTVEERVMAIYNGEVTVEEAQEKGWFDAEFNAWLEEMNEQANQLGDFSATNLSGETVTKDIFADYDLTMVNLWTTTCGYCIDEMPILEKIRNERQQAGASFNIIGICLDVNNSGEVDSDKLEKAQLIVDTAGVTYETLLPDAVLWSGRLQSVTAVPETFFVDREGNIVGQTVMGAQDEAGWNSIIDTMLESLNEA